MKTNHTEDKLFQEIEKLKQPLVGRRWLSWVLFIPILVTFLILPVLASLYPEQANQTIQKLGLHPTKKKPAQANQDHGIKHTTPTTFAIDRVWNPGKLASAHQPWANDCKVCHSESFTQAKNEDCLTCHKDIGKHVHNEKLHSNQLTDVNNKRCADCHRDHMGDLALSNQNKLYVGAACETCHNDIKTQIPETTLQNVGDFSHNHPEFKVQMATLAKPLKMQRVILSNKTEAQEQTGLKFPHDIHVSKKGIKGPKGNEILKCDNCHIPDSAQIGFQPITMENHCQSCHELRFEPGLSNRQVPHGNVSDVLSTLREFYSYVAANPIPKAMQQHQDIIQIRPGDKNKTSAPLITNGDAKTRATLAAREIFEKTACVVCHQISKTSNAGDRNTTGFDLPQYTVAAVTPPHPWMPDAKFNHQPHQQQACTDCHKANQSKKASDVLMPGIAVCKDCHVGKQAEANKIVSDCGLCHGFHSAANIKNKEFNQIHNDTSNAK